MKKISILIFVLVSIFSLSAQEEGVRTFFSEDTCIITLTPGGLQAAITDSALKTTERLVIKGSLDARDFRWLRSTAVNLRYLDLRNATIASYIGQGGTRVDYDPFCPLCYQPNAIPPYSFYKDSLLTTVLLPDSLRIIGEYAFSQCTSLQKLELPAKVWMLGEGSFYGCKQLSEINLPNGLFRIEKFLFYECTSLQSIQIPPTVEVISSLAFHHCLLLKKIVVPDSVLLIDFRAFNECTNMDTVVLGSALNMMLDDVFYGCKALKYMEVKADTPPSICYNTMNDTILNDCTLFLPFATKSSYEKATGWGLFKNVQENTYGVALTNQTVRFSHLEGNTEKIGIRVGSTFDKTWTVQPDQSWLKVSPMNGTSNDTITLEAERNTTSVNRVAHINLQAPGLPTKQVTVNQLAGPKVLAISAGTLSTSLSPSEQKDITDLTLTGTINYLDLGILSERMPKLRRLNLSETEVLSYYNGSITYAGNTIKRLRADSLETVFLPKTAQVLGSSAFYDLKNLKNVVFGDSMTTINYEAFLNCANLTNMVFPAKTSYYGASCLSNCPSLRSMTVLNPVPAEMDNVMESTAFQRVTLYVPKGALQAYRSDSRWNRFKTIIELETAVDERKSKSGLRPYPNPFHDAFSIQGITDRAEVTVIDMQGIVQHRQQVSRGESVTLPNCPSGMYLVRVLTEKEQSNFKITKSK